MYVITVRIYGNNASHTCDRNSGNSVYNALHPRLACHKLLRTASKVGRNWSFQETKVWDAVNSIRTSEFKLRSFKHEKIQKTHITYIYSGIWIRPEFCFVTDRRLRNVGDGQTNLTSWRWTSVWVGDIARTLAWMYRCITVRITGTMHYLVAFCGTLGCSHSEKWKGKGKDGRIFCPCIFWVAVLYWHSCLVN